MVGVVLHTTIDYAGSPTVTAIENGNLRVQQVDFPGVAICNVNKISYKEATVVAHEMYEARHLNNYKELLTISVTFQRDLKKII